MAPTYDRLTTSLRYAAGNPDAADMFIEQEHLFGVDPNEHDASTSLGPPRNPGDVSPLSNELRFFFGACGRGSDSCSLL